MLTAICVTYGRVKHLERALADFLVQDYQWPPSILILNTYPKQVLKYDFPGVRIINLGARPESLGYARNIAVASAAGDRIVIWDDDDRYLPHFFQTFADYWADGLDWLWLDKRLWAEGDQIKGIVGGCHGGCFGFTKKAWSAVGGYPNLTVGEDRVLVQKITNTFPGKKVILGDSLPPFICCWNNGAYHISGGGDDTGTGPGAHERAAAALARRLSTGEEKTGIITLKPNPDGDWLAKAQAFMAAELKKKSMNDLCVIELGRYGDIVNLLPVLLHIHNSYGTPSLMVSREFADLLEGVSYVNAYPVNLRNDQLAEAEKLARKEFKSVLCAQIWGGPKYPQERLCPSYNMESWRKCGFLHKFSDPTWRPVFDRRDRERERLLVDKVSIPGKPMLLVNLTHSVSSPFPAGPLLLTAIQEALGAEFNIVNLGGLKLHRIYDLLGLMDEAACLVSVDSAHLHLAAASNVPTVALLNDDPWLGTVPRLAPAGAFRYTDASQHPEQIVHSIRWSARQHAISPHRWPAVAVSPNSPNERPIFHCVEAHAEKNRTEARRKAAAQKSWAGLYSQGVVRMELAEDKYPRSALSIGERRNLPYLKDVLHAALNFASPDDIIFVTNDDNVLHPELPALLRRHIALYECGCAQRTEFKNTPMPPLTRSPNEFANAGNPHMGRDLFAFTQAWLRAHWDELPDFILGASDWDLCFACMIRNHFGIKTTRRNMENVMFPAELPLGYVGHSWHAPVWAKPEHVNCAPSQKWNRTLFRDWALTHAPQLKFDEHNRI